MTLNAMLATSLNANGNHHYHNNHGDSGPGFDSGHHHASTSHHDYGDDSGYTGTEYSGGDGGYSGGDGGYSGGDGGC